MVKDKKDLDFYKKNFKDRDNSQRYNYVIEFAELWFEILKKFLEEKNLLEDFKNNLDGYTLIGENVGDENHQHIVLYEKKEIYFFALIKNDSLKVCEPLEKCKSFLKKYELKMVKFEKSDLIKNIQELKICMKKLYLETLHKNMKETGEGLVVYFSTYDNNEENIIQLVKLKTFEYRILRKLREKIKKIKKTNLNKKEILQKIKNECDEILGEEVVNLEYTDLMKFSEFVLDFVFKNSEKLNYSDNFAYFIYLLRELYEVKKKEENCDIKNEELKELENLKKFKNKQLENLMRKIKNEKYINLNSFNLTENIKSGKNDLIINTNTKYDELKEEGLKNKFEKGKIYIFTNIGLIASGKTTVCDIIEKEIKKKIDENLLNFCNISSDEIRMNIEKIICKSKKNTDKSNENILKKTKKEFDIKLKEFLLKLDKKKYNFLVADKNFFMNTIIHFKQ